MNAYYDHLKITPKDLKTVFQRVLSPKNSQILAFLAIIFFFSIQLRFLIVGFLKFGLIFSLLFSLAILQPSVFSETGRSLFGNIITYVTRWW